MAHLVRLVLGLQVVPDEHLGRLHAAAAAAAAAARRRRLAVRLVAVFLRRAEEVVVVSARCEGVRY